MYAYLRRHPSIFMPDQKEPHYFASDLPKFQQVQTEAAYLRLFDEASEEHEAIGEASTWYLYSEQAAEAIHRFRRDARVMVFFRNPVAFVQSLHAQFAYNSGQRPDFAASWARTRSRNRLLASASFGTQFGELRRVIPREQIQVFLLEDIRHDVSAQYQRALRFLSLLDDGRTDFPRYNARKTHRSLGLAKFTRDTPKPVERTWETVKKLTGIRNVGFLDRLRKWNVRPLERKALSFALRSEVYGALSDEIDLLGQQLEIDLSHWK